MINKNFEDINETDLLELITNQVLEHKSLDYKEKIELGPDQDRKEFLADISSFANASGGMVIYGLAEEKGIPKSLVGIEGNADVLILSIENLIRDGIRPRIIGIKSKAIALSNSKKAIIISIPKSYNSPHQIIFKEWDKFFSRASNGKYKLDVSELRIAFNLSESYSDRIKKFKQERLGKIIEGISPVKLPKTGKMVLHFVPLLSLNPGQQYDISKVVKNYQIFRPLGGGGTMPRYVFDGAMMLNTSAQQVENYSLLFKNGILEMVNSSDLVPWDSTGHFIPCVAYEETIIEGFRNAINIYQALNMELPILTFLSFVNVSNYQLGIDVQRYRMNPPPISEDHLLLPEILIDDYNINIESALKGWFDSVWNAGGLDRCHNYDENGLRKSRR